MITDQSMPGMFGIDLAREILELRPRMPIAIISGFVDEDDRREAAALGIREFLEKPVLGHGLERAVLRMLEEAPADEPK